MQVESIERESVLKLVPVIMAGGSGTRLWPLSRRHYPKQFIELASSGLTMLQATVQRLQGLDTSEPLLISNEEHRFLAAEQLRAIGRERCQILLEPVGRNTAPAIALAALQAMRRAKEGDDPVLLVLAADHLINDVNAFHQSIGLALPLAQGGKLVTFGVVPTHPETGYGYIEQGASLDGAYTVSRFVEKPDPVTARRYVDSGRYLWNSGMFMFRAGRVLNELRRLAPDILSACESAIADAQEDLTFVRVGRAAFEACRAESIDYAVMEKTPDAVVVPLVAGWSDVGSWATLWDVSDKDSNENVLKGDVFARDSKRTYVHSSHRLVATVGVEDIVVVETKDAVLIAHRGEVQDVKMIVEELKAQGRVEHDSHREVCRPWGKYERIDDGGRYQVKRITVNPGAKLSVQMHHHRAEHWIVVSGTARITNGEETFLLAENQSTYIPVGRVHALENPGKIPLELIEVQSGAYLGEDDIVRYEDKYGRV